MSLLHPYTISHIDEIITQIYYCSTLMGGCLVGSECCRIGLRWVLGTKSKRYSYHWDTKKYNPTITVKKKHRKPTWFWEQFFFFHTCQIELNARHHTLGDITFITSRESIHVIFGILLDALNSSFSNMVECQDHWLWVHITPYDHWKQFQH